MAKITYTYTEFKDYPMATEISKSRAISKAYQSIACLVIFILSLLFCFVDSADQWIAICGAIASPIWFLYLVFFYDKVTNKKIKESIETINENNKKAEK